MNKQKITLPAPKWGTLKTKYKPESNYVSDNELTAGSVNFITHGTGALEKRPTDVIYNTGAFDGTPTDEFEAVFSSGVHHFLIMDNGTLKYSTGDRLFHTAKAGFSPFGSMEYSVYQNRVYMDNGIDTPCVYDLTPSYGGVTYSVPQVKEMGAQPPASAPTFNADSAGGLVPAGGHTYVVTFLYYGDEESNGGSASTLHTVSPGNQTVNLKTIPVGGYGVTARNIYRDDGDGVYLLVGTISNNTATTFVDSVSAGSTPIPATNDLPPVFSYITLNLSRNWVVDPGTPSVLYWSLPGLPDIYDPDNFIVCNPKDPITGVVTFQGVTVVLNRNSFGKILNTTDDTFFYEEVPGTVGCVDNRSIKIRTVDGVPVLVWLSDRGIYKFDGSSVTCTSDAIEDIVNFNIQQASFTTGRNSQSTQADYEGGTSSPGIDLASDPGSITTADPKKLFQSESDWEGGLSLSNLATADSSNQLKVVTRLNTSLSAGTFAGSAFQSGVYATLPIQPDGSFSDSIQPMMPSGGFFYGLPIGFERISKYAQQVFVTRAGTITSLKTWQHSTDNAVGPITYTVSICNDAFGFPGSPLWSSGTFTKSDVSYPNINNATFSPNLAVPAGTYWIVTETPTVFTSQNFAMSSDFVTDPHVGTYKIFQNGNWFHVSAETSSIVRSDGSGSSQTGIGPTAVPFEMTFVQTPVASSGAWTSAIYDSTSVGSAATDQVTNSGSFPTNTSGTLFVDASNDPTMSTGVTSFSQPNPSGSYSPALSGKRYWRFRYTLGTTDNRAVPLVDVPRMTFLTTGVWISQPIDCTTDVTSYDGLQVTQNAPAGTSVTLTAATSSDNVTYSSFGPIGSAVVHRWIKIKAVLTTTSDNSSTPSVSLIRFSWRLTSTFVSSIIDAGQVPTGWGVFQDAVTLDGGTITTYMRSAASSGALTSATFYPVTNGTFPPTTVAPLQYVQWKIVFTSAVDALPSVSGVTINWFIGAAQSPIRVASLFFNKTYYLSAATKDSPTNNIVIVWDFENMWRVFTGITATSLGLFFNEPFYCDGVRNNVYQWLIPATGSGSAINMDVRTKAFDQGNINALKNVRSFRVTGMNTGTTIRAYYSVDRGVTWIEMLNAKGTTGYITSTDGNKFSQYFAADYSGAHPVSGSTVMFRVTSTDAYPCTILGFEPVVYTRSGKYLEVPI